MYKRLPGGALLLTRLVRPGMHRNERSSRIRAPKCSDIPSLRSMTCTQLDPCTCQTLKHTRPVH